MAGRIEGRTAVVTGGCSGIGLATVRRFVEEGARVVIGDIDDAAGEALVAELGGPDVVTYVHVDVTSKDEVDALFRTAKDTYGSVDIAFNNAGISPPDDDSILDTGIEAWRRVQEVNLTSVYLCCKAALPYMLEQSSGSIFTNDLGRGLRVARAVEAGNLSVNSHASVRYWTPFGGYKQSGLGRELGPDAPMAFTEEKNVFIAH